MRIYTKEGDAMIAHEVATKRFSFTGITVSTSNWVDTGSTAGTDDATQYESGYVKKSIIPCAGVTADMLPDVVFAPQERESGNYSGNAVSGMETVTIYAKETPEGTITIPTIVLWP